MLNTECIHSYVRVRPDKQDKAVVVDSQRSVLVVKTKEHFSFGKAIHNKEHAFAENANNEQVYNLTTAKLLADAYRGYNSCIFSYGQTCSGKTYTMKGSKSNPGIIPLLLEDIYRTAKSGESQWYLNTRISYMEIYNEQINDLFKDKNTNLQIRDNDKNPEVMGLTEFKCQSLNEAMQKYEEGESIRKYSETGSNLNSSRSHAVFRVVIDAINKDKIQVKNRAIINLIDLAGSQGIDRTKAEGIVKKEGENINKSLLTLSMVINALGQKNIPFIPFRDSKLTRLLQGSLTGGSRIVVICNINPSFSNLTQTLSTLKFGVSAGQVKLSIKQNSNQSTPPQGNSDKMELSEDHEEQLKRMSSKMEDMSQLITIKQSQIENYKAQLEKYQTTIEQQQKTIQKQKLSIEDLESRLKAREAMSESSKLNAERLKTLLQNGSKTNKQQQKLQQQLVIVKGYNDKLIKENCKLEENQKQLIKEVNLLQNKIKALQAQYRQSVKSTTKPVKKTKQSNQMELDPVKLQDAMLLNIQILERNKQIYQLRKELQRLSMDLQDADRIRIQYELHMRGCQDTSSQNVNKSVRNSNGRKVHEDHEFDEKQGKVLVKKLGVYKKELSAKRKKENKYMLMLKKANDRILELQKYKYQIKCTFQPLPPPDIYGA